MNYKGSELLGTGGFGTVISATYQGEPVAVKRIQKSRFDRREIDMLKKLEHPNIVQFKMHYELDNEIFVVLELMSGGDLYEALVSPQKSSRLVRLVLAENMISGLHYLHQQGILHRDIKPENILLTANFGCAKIADFGYAVYENEVGQGVLDNHLVGCEFYFAPELVTSFGFAGPLRHYTQATDVYALGLTLGEFINDDFPGPNKLRTPFGHTNLHKLIPEDAEPCLAQAVSDSIEINPKKRTDTLQLLSIFHHRKTIDSMTQSVPISSLPTCNQDQDERSIRSSTMG